MNAIEIPSAVERAVSERTERDDRTRTEQLATVIDGEADPARAALLAYELGSHHERKTGDEERAITGYRRAFALDSSLRPNLWALRRMLYRRGVWNELLQVIDVELGLAADDHERVEWLLERAIVSGHSGDDHAARATLEQALRLEPNHQGVNLELERIVVRARDTAAMIETWQRLAQASDLPERKLAYLLDVARHVASTDLARAWTAIDAAEALASTTPALASHLDRLARERLRLADGHGSPQHIVRAVDGLATRLSGAVVGATRTPTAQRELVALHRRLGQLARASDPARAWDHLQTARGLAPDEPVVLLDLIELAAELRRFTDLPPLVEAWSVVENDAARASMLSAWCAEAHASPKAREQLRALIAQLAAGAPSFILVTSTAECDTLADFTRSTATGELADIYLAAAAGAVSGTWVGPRFPHKPDAEAGAALYVQAAELLAYHVATPAARDAARNALAKALETSPRYPAALEALVELEDASGHGEAALVRLRAMREQSPLDRALLERALRVAHSHGLLDSALELEREQAKLDATRFPLAWRLEATLARLGRDEERAKLLAKLAVEDVEPARRRTAMYDAARVHERVGGAPGAAAAIDTFRMIRKQVPDDAYARDALIAQLRAQARWPELVIERRAEAREASDPVVVRRALREAAWVLEIWIADLAQAAAVYDEWLTRLPGDRTALEGIARCRGALGDHAAEAAARGHIAAADDSAEADWLHARSLDRAARARDAAEVYRRVLARADAPVATTAAAISLGMVAAREGDLGITVEANEALARRTTDPSLGAALHEHVGWLYLVTQDDLSRAADAFSAALALEPPRQGALLGAALARARDAQRTTQGKAFFDLASTLQTPATAVAMLLRAAAVAAVGADPELAAERVEEARTVSPDSVEALVAATELGAGAAADREDPFAASDRLIARAELLEKRGALADDPRARIAWDLDRAECLEMAGQLEEAAGVLADVLDRHGDERRAVAALRRITQRAHDDMAYAHASCQLAELSRDRETRLALLREAGEIFDRVGAPRRDLAIAVYRLIVALDPNASEIDRLFELMREHNDAPGLIALITSRLERLAAVMPADEQTMAALLVERAVVVQAVGRTAQAAADLDAVLAWEPRHVDALRLRADIAKQSGDLEGAAALWWRYLAIETDESKRAEIEQLLAQSIDRNVTPRPDSQTQPRYHHSPADAPTITGEESGAMPMPRTAPPAPPPKRAKKAPDAPADGTEDVFGDITAVADLSELAESERREARVARGERDDYEIEVTETGVAPSEPTRPDPNVPGHVEPGYSTSYATASSVSTETGTSQTAPGDTTSGHSVPPGVTMNTAIGAAMGATDETSVGKKRRFLRVPALEAGILDTSAAIAIPRLDARAILFPEQRPLSADDSAVVMLSYSELAPVRSREATEELIAQCERELALAETPAALAALRVEAGRLAEMLDDTERARAHYDAALLADPRMPGALRSLRRIARASGDQAEVQRLLDAELALAGPRERDALVHHRVDMLMASGEHDIARVAVGELLDRAPNDIAAQLAHLELAFLDDRDEELGQVLDQLAAAISEPDLRAALLGVRALYATQHGDRERARSARAAAAEACPDAPATRLAAVRDALAAGDFVAAGRGLLDLGYHVEGEDPMTAAAFALCAQSVVARGKPAADAVRETLTGAAQLAAQTAPKEPLVARVAFESAMIVGDHALASHELSRWSRDKCAAPERAFAAARAAELEPKLGRLWAQVLELDPGDDYALARLRAVYLAADDPAHAIELDLEDARDSDRELPLLRAVGEMIASGERDAAIEALVAARARRPGSIALADALADTYGAAARWRERAVVMSEIAAEPGVRARDVARLRAALAWDQAARVTGADEATITAALDAWDLVLADDARATIAHAATIDLAARLADSTRWAFALTRAETVERSPWAASSLALRRLRALGQRDPKAVRTAARDSGGSPTTPPPIPSASGRAASPTTPPLPPTSPATGIDDPRRTLAFVVAAAASGDLGEAARALEKRATKLDGSRAPRSEPAMLRLRAGQLALDAGDPTRALSLLARVDEAVPGLATDLLDAARRRTGTVPPKRAHREPVSFARVLHDADLAAALGEDTAALDLYQRALELRPADPFVAAPVIRLATARRDASALSTLAFQQHRTADAIGDSAAKAAACELLARIDHDLRDDPGAAQGALQNAREAEPNRIDLLHRLEREHALHGRNRELLELREAELELVQRALVDSGRAQRGDSLQDVVALAMDAATLAVRDKRSDNRLGKLYRTALEADPFYLRALAQLEAILLRAGYSEELAVLQEHIAGGTADPRTSAAFLTRAGETLVGLGRPADAVLRFARAADVLPGYTAALEHWYETALANELWLELAEAATRKAKLGGDAATVASLYHLAAVSLMDKAHVPERAPPVLRLALEADPTHLDAFIRLRRLLEEQGISDELAQVLRRRAEVETDAGAQVELQRALGEHYVAAGDRERALHHYRALLKLEPADVRAHAAIADVAGNHANWRQAADAVIARIPLEREPRTLRTLHYRLGAMFAEHDVAKAIVAFQRALTYVPTDRDSLGRLVDLSIGAGEWKVALDACEQLLAIEKAPARLSAYELRAAAVHVQGFDDRPRAAQSIERALEHDPTNSEALAALIELHDHSGDVAGLVARLERLVVAMRQRVTQDPRDGAAYRTLGRARLALAEHGDDAARPLARAAAELAQIFGAGGDVEQRLLAEPPIPDLARLVGPSADEALFANTSRPELQRLLRLLGPQLAKLLGSDLSTYGVSRKDRLKAPDPVHAIAKDVATSLGFKDVEVYVASRRPHAMAAEPGATPALVLGSAIAAGDAAGVRFAAGAALKLAQLSLAVPARLSADELGVVVLAVLRLFHPDLGAGPGVPEDVGRYLSKLRRSVPAERLEEARPYARALDAYSQNALARDLKIAGLRAGLAASGSIAAGLTILAATVGTDISDVIADPVIQGMVSFSLG